MFLSYFFFRATCKACLGAVLCGYGILALGSDDPGAEIFKAPTTQLTVPMAIPMSLVADRMREALQISGSGQGQILADDCNKLQIKSFSLGRDSSFLELALDSEISAGLRIFSRCPGISGLDAQLVLRMQPEVDSQGAGISFTTVEAELRKRDGNSSLLTPASRKLAQALLIPRLDTVRVDVGDLLLSVDELLMRFMGSTLDAPRLTDLAHLSEVQSTDFGLNAVLSFTVGLPEAPVVMGGAAELSEETKQGRNEPVNQATRAGTAVHPDAQQPATLLQDELDGFVTTIVSDLVMRTDDRELQLDLLAVLLDARLQISEVLDSMRQAPALPVEALEPAGDPAESVAVTDPTGAVIESEEAVRQLFLSVWEQLGELARKLPEGDGDNDAGLRMIGFLAAGDALLLVDALGPRYGVEISGEGLHRLAKMLLAGDAPVSFTPLPLEPDENLRAIFGFTATASSSASPGPARAWWYPLLPIQRAIAQEMSPGDRLRALFPRPSTLNDYLGVVALLLENAIREHRDDSRLNAEQQALFEPLVRATAWKETCWRHYLPAESGVDVIKSSVGAVGMMQIVGRVWRSLFDLDRLESDVSYNVAAGIQILDHYFIDYAVRRGEHEHPGGAENLVKATYAAYNGGPSRLSRYRREGVAARARAVDQQFFRYYEAMKANPWPQNSRCYRF